MFDGTLIILGVFFLVIFVGGGTFLYINNRVNPSLNKKFVSLGVLAGKTKQEIIAVVGPPKSITAQANGGQILVWMDLDYKIELLFNDKNICEGITHQAHFK